MMRVTAGSARGIQLRSPRGRGTRPTAGRLREALFSMLVAADVDFSSVADLYAGSGALGIEALSRGAERCTFVEADAGACVTIRENLERARVADRARVVRAQVGRWIAAPDGPYTLVLADPPYDDPASWGALDRTLAGALTPSTTIVVEHAAREAPPASVAGRALWRDRRQGEGAVAIYRTDDQGEVAG
jgi:16S rRNA (guanine966-N2)-methyltransferase